MTTKLFNGERIRGSVSEGRKPILSEDAAIAEQLFDPNEYSEYCKGVPNDYIFDPHFWELNEDKQDGNMDLYSLDAPLDDDEVEWLKWQEEDPWGGKQSELEERISEVVLPVQQLFLDLQASGINPQKTSETNILYGEGRVDFIHDGTDGYAGFIDGQPTPDITVPLQETILQLDETNQMCYIRSLVDR